MSRRGCFVLTLAAGLLLSGRAAFSADEPSKIFLHKDWQIQSSCEVKAGRAEISARTFDAKGWHHTDVPSTVVGALVADKPYPDPNYGTNLKSFPGMDYSSKTFFANQDLPKGSPFRCSWWFRTEFSLPSDYEGATKWLHLLGINYRANVWLNGQKIADASDVAATLSTISFNVTNAPHYVTANTLSGRWVYVRYRSIGLTRVESTRTRPG